MRNDTSKIALEAANTASADTADLREQVSNLTAAIAVLAAAALAPKQRVARSGGKTVATVSEADRACAEGSFRRGYRGTMFRDLLAKGVGVHLLSETAPVSSGYPARSAVPVAQAIARRLSRRPLVGYTLVVDVDESDNAKTELVFARRTAADTADTTPETDDAE